MSIVTSLYVHVPFCRHLCNYCDFYKRQWEPQSSQLKDYATYLRGSWERHESLMREHGMEWRPLESLYFGGGTPSVWGVEGAEFFAEVFSPRLPLASGAEVTFEIDPGAWDEASLKAWQGLGVNRYSVGTQALDENFLKILDRAHDREQTFALLERLEGENFSVDFLLGAPDSHRQQRQVLRELEELLRYGPQHVSLYILNPSGGYPLKAQIPDDEWTGREYLEVSEYLRSKGFDHYEVSNFARGGRESRHNLRYWMGESVAALGPTGTGYFAKNKQSAWRYRWKPSGPVEEPESLSENELRLERLYLRLRLNRTFQVAEILPGFEGPFTTLLEQWALLGLVQKHESSWQMQPSGWVILDSLMDQLFGAIPSL